MGTRGTYGFRIGGKDIVTYNHSDSYPSYLGRAVLTALAGKDIERLRTIAQGIELVNEQDKPTEAHIAICRERKLVDLKVSTKSLEDWYCLLREAQGEIGWLLDGKVPFMTDGAAFLADSLFCEWAYLINLDDGVLEVYKGFNKDPRAAGRYASLMAPDQRMGYYGVRLLRTIPLADAFAMDDEQRAKAIEELEPSED
jgi:hypothetical protein